MGDVFRTTCILNGLKEEYPNSHISWITKNESIPLLENNLHIDALLSFEHDAYLILQTEEFDLVINPDASPNSSRLATLAKGHKKLGFGYHQRGYVFPFNEEAIPWFNLGVNDSLKKANNKTYQRILLDICRMNPSDYELTLRLTQEEKKFAEDFVNRHGLESASYIIGLNTGASGRWPQKKWTEEGYVTLIKLLLENLRGVKILLYGGPGEKERNIYLKNKADSASVIDTGFDNSIRKFAALLGIPDLVITGDTLAMHLAIAFRKKVIVLFGPTSHAEIELYGRGEKIFADMECLTCYKQFCDKTPNCMDLIPAESVYSVIKKYFYK
jgi:heptosyltransferase-2